MCKCANDLRRHGLFCVLRLIFCFTRVRAYTPKFVQAAVTRHLALCEYANVQMCKCAKK